MKKIHLWLALPFGIVMSIICITGAILVLEKPLTALFYPEYNVPRTEVVEARSSEPHPAAEGAKGSDVKKRPHPKKAPFFAATLKLHRWLLDAPANRGERTLGKTITGVTVIMFVIDLLTGLYLWWPRTRKVLSNRLRVATSKGLRRLLYDTHVSLGFWSMLVLLIISVTGLTWSFPVCRTMVSALLEPIVGADGVRGAIFSLHTGTWGGVTSQAIYFVACLIGTALPLTGYYMWWKKRK